MATEPERQPRCPRCDEPLPAARRGRPRIWCSQRCRRAAYEERRAAASGAIALEVVELQRTVVVRPVAERHSLDDCLAAVAAAPTACRRVLDAMTRLAQRGELTSDPRWDATVRALVRLVDELNRPRRRY